MTNQYSLRVLFSSAAIALLAGCAGSQVAVQTEGSTSNGSSGSEQVASESPTVALAADAFACVLADETQRQTQCEAVARACASTASNVRAAQPDTIERLTEVLVHRARAERMPPTQRMAFARWFDLGMSAAREAAQARAASHATNIERVRRDPELSSDVAALEHAASVDAQALASRGHLDQLRAFAHEGNDGAENATAIAVAIVALRLKIAEQADSALRVDALTVASALAVESAGPAVASAHRSAEGTPAGNAARREQDALAAESVGARTDTHENVARVARAAIAQMGTTPCAQAVAPIRTFCESAIRASISQ
jgi:hypothetical protein